MATTAGNDMTTVGASAPEDAITNRTTVVTDAVNVDNSSNVAYTPDAADTHFIEGFYNQKKAYIERNIYCTKYTNFKNGKINFIKLKEFKDFRLFTFRLGFCWKSVFDL